MQNQNNDQNNKTEENNSDRRPSSESSDLLGSVGLDFWPWFAKELSGINNQLHENEIIARAMDGIYKSRPPEFRQKRG